MLKKSFLTAMLAVLILGGPALAGELATTDIDGTPWGWSFDGEDLPTLPPQPGGFVNIAMNSAQYNDNYNIADSTHTAGYLTSNGNPGGSYGLPNIIINPGPPSVSQVYPGLQKSTGWTLEWNFVNYNTTTVTDVFAIHDDVGGVQIDFAPNLVTIRDGLGSDSDSIAVDMSGLTFHTFRVVRIPDSLTVELYVDNDWGNPASVTPTVAAWPAADGGNVNYLALQSSPFEASLDWVGLHTGATPATNLYGDVNLDGFVGGTDITRIIANWGIASPVYSQGDVNNDGAIGAADYNAVLNNWGDGTLPPPEAPGTIPEPGTLLLLAGGVLAGLIRRR